MTIIYETKGNILSQYSILSNYTVGFSNNSPVTIKIIGCR